MAYADKIWRGKGFSLVETLFYIALFSFLILSIASAMLLMVRSTERLRASRALQNDAVSALARIMFEIRGASGINDTQSIFGTHPGALALLSTDGAGAPRAVSFSVLNDSLYLFENGAPSGALTGSSTVISGIIFKKILTSRSIGVKIELTLSENGAASSNIQHFYSTALLRNSY
jgi:type II secretory pathway pseudopilin PulG